jgi:hypothetical protein
MATLALNTRVQSLVESLVLSWAIEASGLRRLGTHLKSVIRLCDAKPANFVLKRGAL